jgi:GTP 3',8-cyclase / cyclic pyranopterin monophosphate synthase
MRSIFRALRSTCYLAKRFSTVPKRKARPTVDPALTPSDAASTSSVLVDRFGRQHNYLRISLTERCNLRCTYCMPDEGVKLTPKEDLLTADEIQRLLRLFVNEGVTRVRFTGGEPLLRHDLLDIVSAADSLRGDGLSEIAMTTNGVTLGAFLLFWVPMFRTRTFTCCASRIILHPCGVVFAGRKAQKLADAGMDTVNVSLDTLDPFKFQLMTRRNGMEKVRLTQASPTSNPNPTLNF